MIITQSFRPAQARGQLHVLFCLPAQKTWVWFANSYTYPGNPGAPMHRTSIECGFVLTLLRASTFYTIGAAWGALGLVCPELSKHRVPRSIGPATYPPWSPSPVHCPHISRTGWCRWTRSWWGEARAHAERRKQGGKVLHGSWGDNNQSTMSLQSLGRGTTSFGSHRPSVHPSYTHPRRGDACTRLPIGERILAGVDTSILRHLDCSPGLMWEGLIPEWPHLSQGSSQAHPALPRTLFPWLIKSQSRVTPKRSKGSWLGRGFLKTLDSFTTLKQAWTDMSWQAACTPSGLLGRQRKWVWPTSSPDNP